MELIQSKLFIFYESPEHAGKWIPARVSLYSDCKFEVKVPDEDKTSFNLSQNCILQVPLDSVWNRIPPLPYRRSVKETFSLQVQKGFTIWFLANSEDERNQWSSSITSIVDTMLSSHMEDLGISSTEFQTACSETTKEIHSQFHKRLFEQLWAANEYEIFKRMMLQKNLELQLQALDLLAHQYGMLPEAFLPDDNYVPSNEEKTIMDTVMQRYAEENCEPVEADEQKEQKEVIQATKARLEGERQKEIKLMEQAMETSLHDSPKIEVQAPFEIAKPVEVSPEEARRRAEYLRQQRDKLLALKKQEREKLLQKYEENSSGQRPRSAKAAQRAVQEVAPETVSDPSVQAFRSSLAARLKAEVIEKK